MGCRSRTFTQALTAFWRSFGVPAYEENCVPSGKSALKSDYITFSISEASSGESTGLDASIWTRSTSWAKADGILRDVSDRIGMGGLMLHYDDGVVWLKKGTPFSQSMGDPVDGQIKRKYISLDADFISKG